STYLLSVFLLLPPPPRSTLFPYTTLFRSQRRRLLDLHHGLGGFSGRHRDAHDPAVCVLQAGDLVEGRLDVTRVGLGHRLNDDFRRSADDDIANANRDRFPPWSHLNTSLYVTSPTSPNNRARPT